MTYADQESLTPRMQLEIEQLRVQLAERKLERALAGLQAIETGHDTYFVDRYGHTLTARTALSEISAMGDK